MAWLALTLRLTVALVCLTAATGKVRRRTEYRDFVAFLGRAGLPARVTGPTAAGVVLTEFTVAGLAPWPVVGWLGAALGAVLFAVFTGGVATAVATGRVPPCRCFGTTGVALNRSHVVRNALLFAVALGAAVGSRGSGPAVPPAGWLLALAGALVPALSVLFWEDIVSVLLDGVTPAKTGVAK